MTKSIRWHLTQRIDTSMSRVAFYVCLPEIVRDGIAFLKKYFVSHDKGSPGILFRETLSFTGPDFQAYEAPEVCTLSQEVALHQASPALFGIGLLVFSQALS